MTILKRDPLDLLIGEHNVGKFIVDDTVGGLCEANHWLWERHGALVLQWLPDIPWTTTSLTSSVIGANDTTINAQRLGFFPMWMPTWRINDAGDMELDVVVVGRNVKVTMEVRDNLGLLDVVNVSLPGLTVTVDTGVLSWTPNADAPWLYIRAAVIDDADPGEITMIRALGAPSASPPANPPR